MVDSSLTSSTLHMGISPIMDKTQRGLEALVMATSTGLDDAVLNAPLPDISLPVDTSSAMATASMELHPGQHGHLSKSHPHMEGSTAASDQKVDNAHNLMARTHSVPRLGSSVMGRPTYPVSIDSPHQPNPLVPERPVVPPIHPVTNSNSLTVPDSSLGVTDDTGRPAKRRRGGRRVADPNMTIEDRRRQRVLKNRESAMRSLAKKAKFSEDLQKEQATLQNVLQTKQAELRKLVDDASDFRTKLHNLGESDISSKLSVCIDRCLSIFQDVPSGLTESSSTHAGVSLAPALVPPLPHMNQ